MEIDRIKENRSEKNSKNQPQKSLKPPKLSVTELDCGKYQVSLELKGKRVSASAYSPLNAFRMAKAQWALLA